MKFDAEESMCEINRTILTDIIFSITQSRKKKVKYWKRLGKTFFMIETNYF